MFHHKVFRTISLAPPELGREAYPALSLLGEKVLFSVPPNTAHLWRCPSAFAVSPCNRPARPQPQGRICPCKETSWELVTHRSWSPRHRWYSGCSNQLWTLAAG